MAHFGGRSGQRIEAPTLISRVFVLKHADASLKEPFFLVNRMFSCSCLR